MTTRAERIEQFLKDDRELRAQTATPEVERKRADIKAQLQALDAIDRWHAQEHRPELAMNERKEEKRRKRRAAALERDEAIAAMKANPARRELLRNLVNNANLDEESRE
jgi:hypothetical protein